MNNNIEFINHTTYGNGFLKVDDLLSQNFVQEHKVVSVTDYYTLAALPELFEKAEKIGVKVVAGLSLIVSAGGESGDVILLAKNKNGLSSLNKIIKDLPPRRPSDEYPVLTIDDLKKYSDNVVLVFGSKNTILGKTLLSSDKSKAQDLISEFKGIYGERILCNIEFPEPEGDYNKYLFNNICKPYEIDYMLTNDNRVSSKHEIPLLNHKLFSDSGYKDKSYTEIDSLVKNSVFKTKDEYLSYSPKIMNLFNKNKEISDNFESYSIFKDPELVRFKGGYSIRDRINKEWPIFSKGLKDSGKADLVKSYRDRISEELSIIEKMGFEDYFLVLDDIYKFAKDSGLGYGLRGSAVGSLVLHVLGMTNTDPIENGLLFERFLNEGRNELPDVDFEVDDVKKVNAYIISKYGNDNVAFVPGYTTVRTAKSAIDRTIDALSRSPSSSSGVKWDEVRSLIFKTGDYGLTRNDLSSELKSEKNNRLVALSKTNKLVKYVLTAALKYEAQITNRSQKMSGVVIANHPIVEDVSLTKMVGAESKFGGITPYFMESSKAYVQKMGFVKMDVLPNNILGNTLKLFKDLNIKGFDYYSWASYDDPNVFKLFCDGHTESLNQFQELARKKAIQLQPKSFSDIIALMALIRPGIDPAEQEEYLNRRSGAKQYAYDHPILEGILKDTCGVILFEEQIMHIAKNFGGLSPSDADRVRTSLKKGNLESFDALKNKFVEGAKAQSIDERLAQKIFGDLRSKAGKYYFNKSHTAEYADLCYKQAWAKYYYPAEYFSAFVTKDDKKSLELADKLISEMKERGLVFISPDINRSDMSSTTVNVIDKDDKPVTGIDFGLDLVVKDKKLLDAILEERNARGYFEDAISFVRRVYSRYSSGSLVSAKSDQAFDNDFLLSFGNLAITGGLNSLFDESFKNLDLRKALFDNKESILKMAKAIYQDIEFDLPIKKLAKEDVFDLSEFERSFYRGYSLIEDNSKTSTNRKVRNK